MCNKMIYLVSCVLVLGLFGSVAQGGTIFFSPNPPTENIVQSNPTVPQPENYYVSDARNAGQSFTHDEDFMLGAVTFYINRDAQGNPYPDKAEITIDIYVDWSWPVTSGKLVGTARFSMTGLSFLTGNYITLSLSKEESLDMGVFSANKKYALFLSSNQPDNGGRFYIARSDKNEYRDGAGLSNNLQVGNHDTTFFIQSYIESEATVTALLPDPADGETDISQEVVLNWTPGAFADKHDVYFGTNFNDVNNANRTNPLGVLVSQNQDATTYAPAGLLDFGQNYYWRIDEVNAPPTSNVVFKGDVWSFTVESFDYPIAGENIIATASSSISPDEGPENTINSSGLDADDLHSEKSKTMWLSSVLDPQAAWIQYEFDRSYNLYRMLIWNHNSLTEPIIGFGIKEATIEYSVDGANWTTLGTHEFARAPGMAGYAPNTTVDLGGVVAKYVKITANSNWGGILPQFGLGEVRFFQIPLSARNPYPDCGATGVDVDVTLRWLAGRQVASHNLYFSDNWQEVVDGTAPVNILSEASCGPLSLDLGKSYYWRVDEVNEAEIPTTWQGELWDFTTQQYLVIDDMEDYNDFEPDRIFDTWIDGWQVPTNGSQAGYLDPPFAEKNIVHSGKQSMPLFYDNDMKYSEVSMTLVSERDWTIRGIGSLSLWFRGYRGSVGSFTEASDGTYTMTASGTDIWDKSDEFHFAYKQLSGAGSIIAKVESVDNTHNWAKAGVMIRDTLDPDSAHVMMVVTPANGVSFERRGKAGETTLRTRQDGITAPQWVKLERTIGSIFIAYYSADGSNWERLGTSEVVSIGADAYIGLALTSHDTNATCEAKFSNVQITGTANPQWSNQDIGIISNDPEPMYVALTNSGGTPVAVYHLSSDATQIDTWTEWSIDLKQFADRGVNLKNVNTLSIGFGDKANPQAGGSGVVYFDDIRLYPLKEPEAN